MKGYIGLDIGGTKILGVLYDKDGKEIKKEKKKTKADEGLDKVKDQIFKVIDKLIEEDVELLGIGAGSPGIIKDEGTVVFSPNIPFRDFNLKEIIEEKYDTKFVLGNDVNVAMFGEWKESGKKEAKNIIGIFVGTGVGGAIIIDGNLYTGRGGAGEIGHMVVNPEGAFCGCHGKGCLEAYSSKTGIQKEIKEQIAKGRKTDLKEYMEEDGAVIKSSSLEKAYDDEDELCVEVMERACYYLGIATGSLINIFNPDLIIFGGGIMESMGNKLLPLIEKEARRHTMPGLLDSVDFELSKLSDDAGVIGAYHLIKSKDND